MKNSNKHQGNTRSGVQTTTLSQGATRKGSKPSKVVPPLTQGKRKSRPNSGESPRSTEKKPKLDKGSAKSSPKADPPVGKGKKRSLAKRKAVPRKGGSTSSSSSGMSTPKNKGKGKEVEGVVHAECDRVTAALEHVVSSSKDPLVLEQARDDLELADATKEAKAIKMGEEDDDSGDESDPKPELPDLHLGYVGDVRCPGNAFEIDVNGPSDITFHGSACFKCIKEGLVTQLPTRSRTSRHPLSYVRYGVVGIAAAYAFKKCVGLLGDEFHRGIATLPFSKLSSFGALCTVATTALAYHFFLPMKSAEMPDTRLLRKVRRPGLQGMAGFLWETMTMPAKAEAPANCRCTGTYSGDISAIPSADILGQIVQNWALSPEGAAAAAEPDRKECFEATVYDKDNSTKIQSLRKSQVTKDSCDLSQNVSDSELRRVVARIATTSKYQRNVVVRSMCNYAKRDRSIGMGVETILSSLSAMPE